MQYTNPVIPGFHPDPSICRVGEDYYLVTSSFEYFPGVPVFHSRDLVHWEQLGCCLTRTTQIDLRECPSSGGIWAPTIRYHQGLFYMVVVDASCLFSAGSTRNFYVTAQNPAGPWSDPIPVAQEGIDPSLFFDEDGTCYFTSNGGTDDQGLSCIQQSIIDPATGRILDGPRMLWHGSGGRCIEAPHLYHIADKYYLMVAEGGTEYGHMETIARSDSPWGPWEECPFNPILTNRTSDQLPIQCAGHGDLVQAPDGSWYMVFLGVRPSAGQLHHLGRETFLMPVEWREGWPYVGNALPQAECMLPEALVAQDDPFAFSGELSQGWVALRVPPVYSLHDGALTLKGRGDTLDDMLPAALFLPQTQFEQEFTCRISYALSEGEQAGITAFYNQTHHYEICVEKLHNECRVRVWRRAEDMHMLAADVCCPDGLVELTIRAERMQYSFALNGLVLAKGATSLLSTELNPFSFTGVMIGPYVTGHGRVTLVTC